MILSGKSETNSLEIDNMSQESFILAVETSSRIGSVAIAIGGEILAETVFSGPMRHSAEIFPAVITLLNRAGKKPYQIDHIYISGGPGSFTGLRIATTLAKVFHLANKTRIVQVDTLDVIASNIDDYMGVNNDINGQSVQSEISTGKIAPVIDAKRGQFYIAVYHHIPGQAKSHNTSFNKDYRKILPDSLMSSSEFLAKFACAHKPIWLLGDGLVYYKDKFKTEGVRFFDEKYWSPRASKVHMLGWQMAQKSVFADPVNLTPFYLSRPDVIIKPR